MKGLTSYLYTALLSVAIALYNIYGKTVAAKAINTYLHLNSPRKQMIGSLFNRPSLPGSQELITIRTT